MKNRTLTLAAIVIAFATLNLAAGDQPKPAQPPEMDAMMKAWMDYATPGPVHKAMQGLVGTWDTSVKSYMMGPTPTESKGTSVYVSLMDGRYLQETAEGIIGGMPFHGMGIYGYDNAMKAYVSCWIDNMGTGVMYGTGTTNDGGKTVNYTSKAVDPMTGKEQSFRSVMHEISADQYTFEMYGPGMDGKETKMIEITYNRKK